jgi:hypothetical protein
VETYIRDILFTRNKNIWASTRFFGPASVKSYRLVLHNIHAYKLGFRGFGFRDFDFQDFGFRDFGFRDFGAKPFVNPIDSNVFLKLDVFI